MKRNLAVWIVAAVLLALPLSHFAKADPPKKGDDTVLICHVSGNDSSGKVIAVNDDAIAAHRAHGDCFVKCATPGEDCFCFIKPPPHK